MTKRRVIVKVLERHGFAPVPGSGSEDHEKFVDVEGFITVPVPRHREIGNMMAQIIYKEAGIPRKDWRF